MRNRSLIEAVFDELKNLCQIEYSSHRLPSNSMVNLLGALSLNCLLFDAKKTNYSY
ncbi:MAG: transposase [Candidatus Symbiodolus clandestinus]